MGKEIAQEERDFVKPEEDLAPPATLYLGMDGTGIPMRSEELSGRSGKQPDGSAKTREVKLVTVWSAEGREKDGTPVRDAGSVTYSAAIESAAMPDWQTSRTELSEFAQRVEREAHRRGFQKAPRQVVLGDGAAWIWNIADFCFPEAIQIVDRFHAKQHLSKVAKAVWGPESELGKEWAKERHAALDQGRLDDLIAAISLHAHTCPEARQCIEYIQRTATAWTTPASTPSGLSTSSGVLEAGCKHAIGARLKRAGMHRHALVPRRRQRHHRPALLPPKRQIRRVLGKTRQPCRMNYLTSLS